MSTRLLLPLVALLAGSGCALTSLIGYRIAPDYPDDTATQRLSAARPERQRDRGPSTRSACRTCRPTRWWTSRAPSASCRAARASSRWT